MTFEQIIQVGGIAICLWEMAKIWLAKPQQEEIKHQPVPRIPKAPRNMETKEELLDYLKNEWYDREFLLGDVCPPNWSRQKLYAAMWVLTSYGEIKRREVDGRYWYKISS